MKSGHMGLELASASMQDLGPTSAHLAFRGPNLEILDIRMPNVCFEVCTGFVSKDALLAADLERFFCHWIGSWKGLRKQPTRLCKIMNFSEVELAAY